MNYKISELSLSFLVTVLLLTFLEIVATAFIPALGISNIMLPFDILLILFLAFRVRTPYLPILVMGIQLFHSMFTVEGWAHGTLTGVIICILIAFLRDIVELTSSFLTIVVTSLACIAWYLISSVFFFVSVRDFELVSSRFIDGIPESLIIGLISPIFFLILDKIWRVDYHRMMEA